MSEQNVPTILVVDDTQQNVQVLTQMLRGKQYKVLAAFNGEDAIALLSRKTPDLILLDVMMPGMDGFETCREIRKEAAYDDIPIIFLSALTDVEAKVKALESGGVDYITKPFQQLEVLARIELHLRLRRLELERQLNVARLEKMNIEKDEVLGIISHDMRNPIGGIIGISNFLRTDGPSDNQELKDMLTLIETSAERLLLLVNDLLDIALIEANSLQLTFTETDIGAYCHDVIQLHRATAKSKGVRLDLIERVEGIIAEVDVTKFSQVVGNLVSNAIKFTNEGGQIRVEIGYAQNDATQLELQIIDSGIGIPNDLKPRLFEKFGAQRIGTKGEKGTGLGMPLVKRYVDLHHGTITVESMERIGTTFTIRIPLKHSE
jgi:two-component system sensor histidine kinase/response regulator